MSDLPSTPAARPVLITGATGDVGGVLVDELHRRGVPMRVLVRRKAQAEEFRGRGITPALGDMDDPASLRAAMQGCDRLMLILPQSRDQLPRERNAVDAAVACDVGHVVKLSTADANPESPVPWARDLARGDQYLQDSGLAWTRLQPASFMKNLLTEAAAVRRGLLPQTSGHGATAWIDHPDIAAVAARVLTDPDLRGGAGPEGRSYRLTGTPATSYAEIAVLLSEVLGRRVRYLQVPAPLMYAGLRVGGQPHWLARGLVEQFLVVRRGLDHVRLTSTAVADLLHREPTSLRDFITRHRDAFA